MSIKIMQWVWDEGPEEATEMLVLLALADIADDEGLCWPSVARIARKCRMSDRNARRIIRRLEDGGWLLTQEQRGRNQTNRYTIQKPDKKIGQFVRADKCDMENRTNATVKPDTAMSAEPSRTVSIEPSLFMCAEEEPSSSQQKSQNVDEAFERFWQAYPKEGRKSKKAVKDKFRRALKEADADQIIAAVKRYAAWLVSARPGEFRPPAKNALTWINQGCWDDDLTGAPSGNAEADQLEAQAVAEDRSGNHARAVLLRAKAARVRNEPINIDAIKAQLRIEEMMNAPGNVKLLRAALAKLGAVA